MVKNHKLAKSIMDSRCVKVPKSLAKKLHRCDKYNLVLCIDHNASINILKKGLNFFNLYAKADYHKLPVPAGSNACRDLNKVKEAGRNHSTCCVVVHQSS